MKAIEIYNNHINEFKKGNIKVENNDNKFNDVNEFKSHLLNNNISYSLFNICAQKTLTPWQQIGFYTLLDFSSKQAETKFKKGFIDALNKIGIF